jgi:hypothetical protein
MHKHKYIPVKKDKFVPVEIKNNHKALAGGICTAIKSKVARTGRLEHVEALDSNGEERFFAGNRWRFLKR